MYHHCVIHTDNPQHGWDEPDQRSVCQMCVSSFQAAGHQPGRCQGLIPLTVGKFPLIQATGRPPTLKPFPSKQRKPLSPNHLSCGLPNPRVALKGSHLTRPSSQVSRTTESGHESEALRVRPGLGTPAAPINLDINLPELMTDKPLPQLCNYCGWQTFQRGSFELQGSY